MSPTRRLLRESLGLASIVLALACGGGTDEGGSPPSELLVSPDSVTLPQLQQQGLTVTVRDAGGHALGGITPSFTSSNTAIVTASTSGQLTSVGPVGTAHVTVSAGGLTTNIPVVVEQRATTITLGTTSLVLAQLDSAAPPSVTVLDAVGDPIANSPVVVTPADPSLLAVSPSGQIVSLGRAAATTLQFQSGGVVKNLPVTILQVAQTVALTPDVAQVGPGATRQFQARVLDRHADEILAVQVNWQVVGGLATISSNGLLSTGNTPGVTLVTATFHPSTGADIVASAPVHVTQLSGPTLVAPSGVSSLQVGGMPWDVDIAPNGTVIAVGVGGPWLTHLAAFTTADTLPPVGSPLGVRVNPAGTKAYAAGVTPPPGHPSGIAVIDLATGSQLAYLEHGEVGIPYTVGISQAGDRVVLGTDAGNLVIFDGATGAWITTLNFPGGLFNHIISHPTKRLMYASSFTVGFGHPSAVVEINLTTQTLRELPIVTSKAQGIALSGDGRQLFVADENGPMQVFDLDRDRVIGQLPAVNGYFGLRAGLDGHTVYAVAGEVAVINTDTWLVTKRYDTPGARRVAVAPDQVTLVVASDIGNLYRFIP